MVATTASPEYAIIGGGIAGLTLAIALHHRGVRVHIYEQAPQLGEIGAGVAFTPNAVQAMKICHPGIHDAFEKLCTHNLWPSKQHVWFDYYDGQHESEEGKLDRPAFTITTGREQNGGVHRARFLDEMVKLFPSEQASFGKHLERYEQDSSGKYVMTFADGSTATADAILGCDGIKSKVRRLMFGEQHPCAYPTYSHKYAYRALAPMDAVVDAIGEEKAQNSCMHMGKGGHLLTFPINHGRTVNVVAFRTTEKDWPDHSKLTAPAVREDALRDFAGYGHSVTKILELAEPKLDIWAIFHLADHPPPSFNQGHVCLVGDAAHATSPHHGAGAGFCIEDSAVLAELLADERVVGRDDIEYALAAYDATRRERGEWLVQSSAHIGDTYEWLAPGIKDNIAEIEADINRRNRVIADVNVGSMCSDARNELGRRLEGKNNRSA